MEETSLHICLSPSQLFGSKPLLAEHAVAIIGMIFNVSTVIPKRVLQMLAGRLMQSPEVKVARSHLNAAPQGKGCGSQG